MHVCVCGVCMYIKCVCMCVRLSIILCACVRMNVCVSLLGEDVRGGEKTHYKLLLLK